MSKSIDLKRLKKFSARVVVEDSGRPVDEILVSNVYAEDSAKASHKIMERGFQFIKDCGYEGKFGIRIHDLVEDVIHPVAPKPRPADHYQRHSSSWGHSNWDYYDSWQKPFTCPIVKLCKKQSVGEVVNAGLGMMSIRKVEEETGQ
jgi:hypothetical protein